MAWLSQSTKSFDGSNRIFGARSLGAERTIRKNLMTTLNSCGIILLWSTLVMLSFADNQMLKRALPDGQDMPGFQVRPTMNSLPDRASMASARLSDGLSIRIMISVFDTAAKADAFPLEFNKSLSTGRGYVRIVPVPGSIGKAYWENREPGNHVFSIAVSDGKSLITVRASTNKRDPQGRVTTRPHSQADVDLAVRLSALTLDRLTAIGLTSRPVSSASAAARQRMGGS